MSKFAGALLSVEKPGRLVLLHPSTRAPYADIDGNVAYIDVYSSDSEIMNSLVRSRTKQALEEKVRRIPTAAELESREIEKAAVLTAGWHLLSLDPVEIDGKMVHEPIAVEWSVDNAKELFSALGGALYYDQVIEFAGARGNFVKASSKS